MEKATIGTILKNRIKECGFTQEEFAEKAEIGHSTLKKYLNGTTPYSYEMLIKFSELLNCSYDFLLGHSKSAVREYSDIREKIRLSDDTIRRLVEYSAFYDTSLEAKRYIKVFDMMIQQKGLITCMADYFLSSSRYMQDTCNILTNGIMTSFVNHLHIPDIVQEDAYVMNLENINLIYLVSQLKDAKSLVSDDFLKELKELSLQEQTQSAVNQLVAQKTE